MNGVLGSFHHVFLTVVVTWNYSPHTVPPPCKNAKEVVGRCLFLEEGDAPFPDDKWRFLLVQSWELMKLRYVDLSTKHRDLSNCFLPFFEYSPILRDFGIRSWNFTRFSPVGISPNFHQRGRDMKCQHQKSKCINFTKQPTNHVCLVDFNNVKIQQVFTKFPPAFWSNLICKVATRSIGGKQWKTIRWGRWKGAKTHIFWLILSCFKSIYVHLVRWFAWFACPFFILFPCLVGWWMLMVGSNIRQNWISRRPYYRRNCKNDKRWWGLLDTGWAWGSLGRGFP